MANAQTLTGVDRSYFYWRGALGIVVGVLILAWPGLTVLTLVTLLCIWLLLVGAITIVEGVAAAVHHDIWHGLASVLVGVVELGVGAYLIQRPHVTALTIVTLLGLVFILQGAVLVFKTFFKADMSGGQRLLSLVLAVLSFVAGIWIWRYPVSGALAAVWLIGLYIIASGALLIALGAEANK